MIGEICVTSEDIIVSLSDGIPPEVPPEDITRKFRLETPLYAFVDKPIPVTGTTPEPNQHFYIMLSEKTWGIDWLDIDETLYEGNSDFEGKYDIEMSGFEEIGIPKVYAAIKQTDFTDMTFWEKYKAHFWKMVLPEVLEKYTAIKTGNQTIVVVNWGVIAAIGALIAFVGYKMYKKRGKK